MPTFIPSISVHFHKLLQNRRLTPDTLDCKLGRVVKMAILHEFAICEF